MIVEMWTGHGRRAHCARPGVVHRVRLWLSTILLGG